MNDRGVRYTMRVGPMYRGNDPNLIYKKNNCYLSLSYDSIFFYPFRLVIVTH